MSHHAESTKFATQTIMQYVKQYQLDHTVRGTDSTD